jgi:hypothetical protein
VFTVKPLHRQVAQRSNWVMGQMSFLERDPDVQAVIK